MAIFLVLVAIFAATPADAARNCTLTQVGDVYCDGGAQPVRVRVNAKVVQLAANSAGTCALTEPGEVYCWTADDVAHGEAAGGNAAGDVATGDAAGGQAAGGEPAAAGASADDDGFGFSPLLLISLGLALVGGGCTLVRFAGQGARPRAASRQRSAPSLSRSV